MDGRYCTVHTYYRYICSVNRLATYIHMHSNHDPRNDSGRRCGSRQQCHRQSRLRSVSSLISSHFIGLLQMASTTTRRKGGAPRSMEVALQVEHILNSSSNEDHTALNGNGTTVVSGLTGNPMTIAKTVSIPVASVKRHKYGTGPFDEHWLNLDCCGLFCAMITYGLHIYGVYAVCLVLLPPWMSTMDEDGVRSLTLAGQFHRLAFTVVAVLAITAHYKAMTTDPGAVPPDAIPLEETKPLDSNTSSTSNGDEQQAADSPSLRKGKRLCRRCKSFKPQRAHHCSVCRRCIIKMDRTYYI